MQMKFYQYRTGVFALVLLATAGTGSFSCKRKPDPELCGKYYRRLARLHVNGPGAALAALRTGEGKTAAMNYCLTLRRAQVECVLKAKTLAEAVRCEASPEPEHSP